MSDPLECDNFDLEDNRVMDRVAEYEPLAYLSRLGYIAKGYALASGLGVVRLAWHFSFEPTTFRWQDKRLLWSQTLFQLLQQDLDNVERGYYPRKLLHQLPLADYVCTLPALLADLPRIWWRRHQGRFIDLAEKDLSAYPPYYRRNFHWQSDGWLSEHSARLYDIGVEFLFGGTADTMRRMGIPSLVDAVQSYAHPRLLDVACGTGRFLLQLQQALPRAKLWGVDLSPYYITKAQQLLSQKDGIILEVANAEVLPYDDGAFDAVSSIFLLHELPKKVRRRVVHQMHRVLRPGGRLMVTDSIQYSDRTGLDELIDLFPQLYYEPYYREYAQDDLRTLLEECGFVVESSTPYLVSKVVVARKR